MTPLAKYDTACTLDEWFMRPRSAFKECLSKMYVNCPTPSLQNYINLKGLSTKTMSCMRCHWYSMHENRRVDIFANTKKNPKRLEPGNQGSRGILLWKKGKISRHCPIKPFSVISLVINHLCRTQYSDNLTSSKNKIRDLNKKIIFVYCTVEYF
jgi:hypothetical protein